MRVYHISSFSSVSVLFPLYEGCIRDAANIWHWAISTLFVSGLTVGRVQASINGEPGSKPFFEPVFHLCEGGVGIRNEGKSKPTGDVAATGQEGLDAGGIAVDTHEMIEFAETAM